MIWFGHISDEISNFEAKLSEMFLEFLEHGFQREKLICKFFQFANKYRALLFKFGLCNKADLAHFVQRVFCR